MLWVVALQFQLISIPHRTICRRPSHELQKRENRKAIMHNPYELTRNAQENFGIVLLFVFGRNPVRKTFDTIESGSRRRGKILKR
jgi:hypothetical protein